MTALLHPSVPRPPSSVLRPLTAVLRLPSSVLCLLSSVLGLQPLAAQVSYSVPTVPASGISVRLDTPVVATPRFGFLPVRAWVENTTDQDGVWTVELRALQGRNFPGDLHTRITLPVPSLQNREEWIYLPIPVTGVNLAGMAGIPGGRGMAGMRGGGGGPAFVMGPGGGRGGPVAGGAAAPRNDEATIRRVLAPTGLLNPGQGVTESFTFVNVSGPPGISPVGLLQQRGSETVLTRPDPAVAIPAGVIVNLHDGGTPGIVVRTISYVDPTLLASVGLSPSGWVQLDLARLGYLQGGANFTNTTTGRAGGRQILVTETGAPAQITNPLAGSLPSNYTASVMQMPGGLAATRIFMGATGAPIATTRSLPGQGSGTTGGAAAAAAPVAPVPGAAPAVPSPLPAAGPAFVTPTGVGSNGIAIQAVVTGPGVDSSTSSLNFSASLDNGNLSNPPLAVVPTLEANLRGKLGLTGLMGAPSIAVVDPVALPADWRVWSSFHGVVLRESDYVALDGGRREALHHWVALGGNLILFPGTPGASRAEPIGAGTIHWLADTLADIDALSLPGALQLNAPALALPLREQQALSPLSALGQFAFEASRVNNTWPVLFLAFFAVIAGPVNLYVFAPVRKRHRLFLTVPVLGVIGSAAVAGVILGQDGLGGFGQRAVVVALLPGQNAAAVFQEQVSRSGFLTSDEFALETEPLFASLALEGMSNTSATLVSTRIGGTLAGSWFRSRTLQAHQLRTVIPTRGRIETVEHAPDGAPVVLSTLSNSLRDFRLVDADNRIWTASEVPAGRRVTLRPTIAKALPPVSSQGTKHLDQVLNRVAAPVAGRWIARSVEAGIAPVATLESIRWSDDTIWYTGVAPGAARTLAAGGAR